MQSMTVFLARFFLLSGLMVFVAASAALAADAYNQRDVEVLLRMRDANFKGDPPKNWAGDRYRDWLQTRWVKENGVYYLREITSIADDVGGIGGIVDMGGHIDLSGLTRLETLTLRVTDISSVDLRNTPRLAKIDFGKMKSLTSLDLSSCPALTVLYCGDAGLTELDLRANSKLVTLYVANSKLRELFLGEHPALAEFDVSDTELLHLDVSGLPALKELGARDCQLQSITLGYKPTLESLSVGGFFETLDLAQAPNLDRLVLRSSTLRELDVSPLHKLDLLHVAELPFEELVIPERVPLKYFALTDSKISSIAIPDATKAGLERNNLRDNRLPLSGLLGYVGGNKIDSALGPQRDVPVAGGRLEVNVGEALDLSGETEIGGKKTRFSVESDNDGDGEGSPCAEGNEYTVQNGIFHFSAPGSYSISMVNDAVYDANGLVTARTGWITVPDKN